MRIRGYGVGSPCGGVRDFACSLRESYCGIGSTLDVLANVAIAFRCQRRNGFEHADKVCGIRLPQGGVVLMPVITEALRYAGVLQTGIEPDAPAVAVRVVQVVPFNEPSQREVFGLLFHAALRVMRCAARLVSE